MRQQRGLGGSLINVTPKIIARRAELETQAEQLATTIAAATAATANPFSSKIEVAVEHGWSISDSAFRRSRDPPLARVCELSGARNMSRRGPWTESRVGFDMDGIEFKVGYDVGATVISSQGVYLNPGAA
jgi:hypothetical protein